MDFLSRFQAVFNAQHRQVAKITAKTATGYAARTHAGETVMLKGSGYDVGANVFYDAYTAEILDGAPDLRVVELRVE